MKKSIITLICMAFLLVLAIAVSFSQEADLSGTWVGTTEVPEQGTDEVTLTLQRSNGEYLGTISDTLGMAQDEECEDIQFKEGTLTFYFSIFDGYEYMTVYMTLTVEGDKMSGYWETEDGTSGSVELERADV
jgi:hypothetical protein